MLANAIGSVLLLGGCCTGLGSLFVAIAIEIPVLQLVWGRTGIVRWVAAANIASFGIGVVPAILWNVIQAPGPNVDPWVWHQTYWLKLLGYAAALFALTLIVEGLVYVRMSRRFTEPLAMRRLLWGTVAANFISYIPLTGYLLYAVRDTGDFRLMPDVHWVKADSTRVYFVDPSTNQINSVRLDGSERVLECSATLGRLEGEVDRGAFYALLRDDPRILYAAADRRWHVSGADGDQRLKTSVPEHQGYAFRADVAVSLQEALAEIGLERPVPSGDEPLDGVYLSSCTQFDWRTDHVEIGPYVIRSGTSPYVGAGPGLAFYDSERKSGVHFGIKAGGQNLACNNPVALPDRNTVVFRCGNSIMVLDLATRRVGRLVQGDSLLLKLPQFSETGWPNPPAQPSGKTARNPVTKAESQAAPSSGDESISSPVFTP